MGGDGGVDGDGGGGSGGGLGGGDEGSGGAGGGEDIIQEASSTVANESKFVAKGSIHPELGYTQIEVS